MLLNWLPWLLMMKRPGKHFSYKALVSSEKETEEVLSVLEDCICNHHSAARVDSALTSETLWIPGIKLR